MDAMAIRRERDTRGGYSPSNSRTGCGRKVEGLRSPGANPRARRQPAQKPGTHKRGGAAMNQPSTAIYAFRPEQALASGLSIIPLKPNKQPAWTLLPSDTEGKAVWKPFQKRRPTPDELTNWVARRPAGFAI